MARTFLFYHWLLILIFGFWGILPTLAAQEPILGELSIDFQPGTILSTGSDDVSQKAGERSSQKNTTPILPTNQGINEIRGRDEIHGQVRIYQMIRLQMRLPNVYQTMELELEPYQPAIKQTPASLMIYNQVRTKHKQSNTATHSNSSIYEGTRLLTKGIAGKSRLQFELIDHSTTKASPNSIPLRERLNTNKLNVASFPIYIVLYPFQKSYNDSAEYLGPVYQYRIRFIKKNFGFVRFRLIPPKLKNKQINDLQNPNNAYFNLQIDKRSYNWKFDPDYVPKEPGTNHLDIEDNVRFSQEYKVNVGAHNSQLNSSQFYARTEFYVTAGETKLVNLQLQKRLSHLVLVLPENAITLLNGIPVTKNKKRNNRIAAPVWENVEVQKLENYHQETPRLKYYLTLPSGKHHLLIQYEGKTWQKNIYLTEGNQQHLELNWGLQIVDQGVD